VSTKLLLVRHGRAGHRSRWEGDDRLRPLSRKGKEQAEKLVGLLRPFQPARVLSSPYLRCVQTVEPLAGALRLDVVDADELAEGNGRKAIELVRGLTESDDTVVVCTHGDIVPEMLEHLASADHLHLPRDARWPKGSAWVLSASDGRFDHALYLPPPA